MKATELIEQLQKIIAENGDVEIYILDNEYPDRPITTVDTGNDKNRAVPYWGVH